MTKKEQTIIALGALVGGSLLCSYAMTGPTGRTISTLCTIFGLGVAVCGFITLILVVKGQK